MKLHLLLPQLFSQLIASINLPLQNSKLNNVLQKSPDSSVFLRIISFYKYILNNFI